MKRLLPLFLLSLVACTPSSPVATQPSVSPTIPSPIPSSVTSPTPTATVATSPPASLAPVSPTPSIAPSPTSVVDEAISQTARLTARDAKAQINIRVDASTDATAQHYGIVGDAVNVLERKQNSEGETWYRVQFEQSGATGWVRSDFVALSSFEPEPQSDTTIATVPMSEPVAPTPTNGGPLRAPMSGVCDCPYDTDKRGRSCGGRSAYSRPGGDQPACYVGEG